MDDKLKPADPSDVAGSIAFALRFNRRKRFHEGDKLMADNSGFVIMKKPPALGGGDNPGRRGSEG
jgi:hypothetical protein